MQSVCYCGAWRICVCIAHGFSVGVVRGRSRSLLAICAAAHRNLLLPAHQHRARKRLLKPQRALSQRAWTQAVSMQVLRAVMPTTTQVLRAICLPQVRPHSHRFVPARAQAQPVQPTRVTVTVQSVPLISMQRTCPSA